MINSGSDPLSPTPPTAVIHYFLAPNREPTLPDFIWTPDRRLALPLSFRPAVLVELVGAVDAG